MRIPSCFTATVSLAILAGCAASEGKPTDEVATKSDAATSAATPATTAAPSAADSLIAFADRSRILGDSTAPLWVVIVSDFQCPYCKIWHDETFPAIKREFVDKGRIRLAYLNLPLPQHQHAEVTAELALCAGAQGRFWEFHDAVFDTQDQWSGLPAGTTFFESVAATAKLDQTKLRSCMESHAMRPLVQADFQRAKEAKVRSTPSFFVGNAMRLEGAVPFDAMRDSINKVLRSAPTGAR
jgi:protein-disulfide isomerase